MRPDRNQRTSGGLELSKCTSTIGHIERRYDGVMRSYWIAEQVKSQRTVRQRYAVRRSVEHHATQNLRVKPFGRARISHVKRELIIAEECHRLNLELEKQNMARS